MNIDDVHIRYDILNEVVKLKEQIHRATMNIRNYADVRNVIPLFADDIHRDEPGHSPQEFDIQFVDRLSRLKTDAMECGLLEGPKFDTRVESALRDADVQKQNLLHKMDVIFKEKINSCISNFSSPDISIKDLAKDKFDHDVIENGYMFYARNAIQSLHLKTEYKQKYKDKIEFICDSATVPASVASGLLLTAKPEYMLLKDEEMFRAEQFYKKLMVIYDTASKQDITSEEAHSCVYEVVSLSQEYQTLPFVPANILQVLNELKGVFENSEFTQQVLDGAIHKEDWAHISKLEGEGHAFSTKQEELLNEKGYSFENADAQSDGQNSSYELINPISQSRTKNRP